MDNNYAPPNSDVTASSGTGGVTNPMLNALSGTKPWVLLIGILSIIGSVFIFIAAARMLAMGSQPGVPGGILIGMAVLYLAMGVVNIVLGIFLVKYSSAIGRLRITREAGDLETALLTQKSFWKLAGIIVLLFLIIMVVGMIIGIGMSARGF